MNWRNISRNIESKGLVVDKATSLADLHRRRRETQAQYFTPEWVSKGIWQVFSAIMDSAKANEVTHFTVLDNAVGSGRLFEGAPVGDLSLYGLDIDSRCIDALSKDAEQAGLCYEFVEGGMEDLTASGFQFAVINPPYSVHLESPNLTPYPCNSFGRFGQSTAAISHEYALEQALDAAVFIAAVLPVSMEGYCRAKRELKSVVYLPRDTFISEGANVETAVYFFGPGVIDQVQIARIKGMDVWPVLNASYIHLKYRDNPRFKLTGVNHSAPVITLLVTGNSRVELHHHNRRIIVKYHCGLVQAKVANGLLRDVAYGKRLPKTIKYQGDGQFLLDVLLLQDKPHLQLFNLVKQINALGGDAWISPTLAGYYQKLLKKHRRAITPMYRVIKSKGIEFVSIKARSRTLLEPGNFNSPSVAKGEVLIATPNGGEYAIQYKNHNVILRRDELQKRFEITGDGDIGTESEWHVMYKGLNHYFPEIAHQYQQMICKAGIDWLAPFQLESLVEGLVSPYGYLGSWEQGSGKARYALALAFLHSGKNMIVLESGLLPEMLIEIEKIGVPSSLWKVVSAGDMPTAKINLVTYATLRKGTRITYPKVYKRGTEIREILTTKIIRTNAQRWRRQISTLICDEGGLLANLNTQQTQAVKTLSAKKLIILDGTPLRNYPSDLLPLSVVSAGNGVAHQPFGVRGNVHVEQRLIESANENQRGEDAFFDSFVITQWVTNEFREEMQTGGKRVVPKINNLSVFRKWLAPNIQRRLRAEPDLAIFSNCPKPERDIFTISWDQEHLGHYLKTATEFANWYKNNKGSSKALNLVTVLARIGAVQRAANSPHVESKSSMVLYPPVTSKQRFALDRVCHWVDDGRKVILYAQSPEVLNRFHVELAKQGIDSVLFTGQQDINKRAKALNDEFRYGSTPVLLSSWVGQRGLNLEQAEVVLFYERAWSSSSEEQAIYRTQRPSQTQKVMVEYLHLAGSIDLYMDQIVTWKLKAADAGLDFGDQASDEEEFLHLDTLLHRFCDDVLNLSVHDAKKLLAA